MAPTGHKSNCPCCQGTTAWSALYPLVAGSADASALSAHSQPTFAKKSKLDWLRIPNWALPTRAIPENGPDDDSLVSLDAILAGRTKNPIRVEDLRNFLRDEEKPNLLAIRSVEFLLSYNGFRAAFFALPLEKQPSRPETTHKPANVQTEARLVSAQIPTPAQPTQPRVTSRNDVHPDPDSQPLRFELQTIIDLYLQPHSISMITPLISSNTLHKALTQAKLTTHPSALDPIASNVHSYLTTEILPRFLDHAVSNLSASTSRGRMIVACVAAAAAIVLEVFLIMCRMQRAARLIALPLWILAIGYAIGSRTGLCFWLAMRGTREHKAYETPSSSTSPVGVIVALPVEEPRRPSATYSRVSQIGRRLTISDDSNHSDLSMAEQGKFSSHLSLEKRASRKLRKSYPVSGDLIVDEARHPPATSLGLLKRVLRLSGTAVDTVPVEDSRVRKLQAFVGLRVAIWLVLGTGLVIGVVLAIP